MPYGRQIRMDRRRRVLLDGSAQAATEAASESGAARRKRSPAKGQESADGQSNKPLAGYSQGVRGPCQQRLVHFIPVRRISVAGLFLATFALAGLLIFAHWGVWIAGPDSWRATPLSLLLDIRSRVGLAGWINTQLWVLITLSCLLTYQLRKHRLDDYRAHYRVWLWLALASLMASVEAGTGLSQVVIASLDPFARVQVGWSGQALVEATLAALVGLLALRVCTELRGSAGSQILWLMAIAFWIPSCIMASPIFKLGIRPDYNYWLVGSLWLIGKSLAMLSACIYLRHVYVAAQKRFVVRGGLLAPMPSWKDIPYLLRLRRSDANAEAEAEEPAKPKRKRKAAAETAPAEELAENETETTPNRSWWRRIRLPQLRRKKSDEPSSEKTNGDAPAKRSLRERLPKLSVPKVAMPKLRLPKWKSKAATDDATNPAAKAPLDKKATASPTASTQAPVQASGQTAAKPIAKPSTSPTTNTSAQENKSAQKPAADTEADGAAKKSSKWSLWGKRAPKGEGNEVATSAPPGAASSKAPAPAKAAPLQVKRSDKPADPKSSEKTSDASSEKGTEKRSLWSRLPKLPSLSSMRLPPPKVEPVSTAATKAEHGSGGNAGTGTGRPSTFSPSSNQPRPSTQPPASQASSTQSRANDDQYAGNNYGGNNYASSDDDDDDGGDEGDGKSRLSKAERKRLKRLQQENRRAA